MNYGKRMLKVLVSYTSKNSEQITFVNILTVIPENQYFCGLQRKW